MSTGVTSNPHNYLLVVSEREALAWVLREQRMAFRSGRRAARGVESLGSGDTLLIYTTRSCFHNPGRDRGRVIASAEVRSSVGALDPPISFGGSVFPTGCTLRISKVAPFGAGVDLASLVTRLSFPSSWPTYVRRTLVPLESSDVAILQSELKQVVVPRAEALPTYLDRLVSVRNRTHASS
jgi:hypothetical protein